MGEYIPKIFFISDTHFDHTNIIKYCKRPFKSTDEMNNVLLTNWNKTVCAGDIVFYLGDLVYGTGSRGIKYWLPKLNGKIVFISGSHDITRDLKQYHKKFYTKFGKTGDVNFLLVHDPADIPETWGGWVIHGHHHNNHMDNYPFINGVTKNINMSAELINYTPVNIDALVNLNFQKVKRLDTINGKPEYF